MLGTQGPGAGQKISHSLLLYFMLCMFCQHIARQGILQFGGLHVEHWGLIQEWLI